MCGILGTLPVCDQNLFKTALDTLAHRGPDGSGIWHDPNISLGHRRLSILDVSECGSQPMSYLDGRYNIIFNGEIYNFLEIRSELQKLGYHFRSESDTEVVLASFAHWGPDCLLKFNGMWAIAIWDKAEKKLFLSRDRFGKKPLFYARIGDRFVFASEMKAIFPFLPRIEPCKDFKWMSQHVFAYENTEKCLIEGIKRFPAGHYGYYYNQQLVIQRYWNILDHLVEPERTYDAQVEKFRELFLDACKLRMRSDVPIGTALSGGLDSSATISAMAHLARNSTNPRGSQDWQHAFVASFPDTPIDESGFAKKVTDHLGIGATFINIDPVKHWQRLEEYFYYCEDLYLTPPIPMIMTYAAVKEHGVTVTIDGHGADELFSGYGHLLESLWDAGADFSRIKDILNTHLETRSGFSQVEKTGRLKLYLNFMGRKLVRKLLNREQKSQDHAHPGFARLDNFSQQLYIIFNETILPTLLRNYDRYSMISGVEIRMPFMDHRLVTYVHSLPYSSKFGHGFTKKLIRDAMAPFMPPEITWRKTKIGFNSPIVNWMQGPLKEWFNDIIHSQDFSECQLIDNHAQLREKIVKITSGVDSSWANAESSWAELSPVLWERAIIRRSWM